MNMSPNGKLRHTDITGNRSGMKRKAVFAAVAAVGTVIILTFSGTFLVNNVFAAEGRITITGENPDALQSLSGAEALSVYKNGVYGDTGCTLILPEGYVPEAGRSGMYISQRHPVDSSNIYYVVSDSMDTELLRESLQSGTYEKQAEKRFKEAYGAEASLNSFVFEGTQIDGCPAYVIRLSCTADGMTMEQLIYMIVADRTYTVTYSQAADDERMDDFEKSAGTIRVNF